MTTGKRGGGQRPRVVIPDNVAEFYSNSLNVGTTLWDFTLFFGSTALPDAIGASPSSQVTQIRVDCVVRMSPQHAKAAATALGRLVAQYEMRFGEIAAPDEKDVGGDADAS